MRLRDHDHAALARLARSYGLRARLGPRRAVPASLLRLEAEGLAYRLDPWGKEWAPTPRGRTVGLGSGGRSVADQAASDASGEVVDDGMVDLDG